MTELEKVIEELREESHEAAVVLQERNTTIVSLQGELRRNEIDMKLAATELNAQVEQCSKLERKVSDLKRLLAEKTTENLEARRVEGGGVWRHYLKELELAGLVNSGVVPHSSAPPGNQGNVGATAEDVPAATGGSAGLTRIGSGRRRH